MKRWLFMLLCVLAFARVEEARASFTDVPPTATYKQALEWAVQQGIIQGYPDGTFRPNDNVTEPQFLKMYMELLSQQGLQKASSTSYAAYYQLANIYALPALTSSIHQLSHTPITRGQVAQLIAFAKGVGGSNMQTDSAYMLREGYSNGQLASNALPAERYGADNPLRRYHAVQFLYKAFANNERVQLANTASVQQIVWTGPTAWPTKTYRVNTHTYYRIVGAGYAHFTVEHWYKKQQIGSYTTGKGATKFGITVGQSYEELLRTNRLAVGQRSTKEQGYEAYVRDEGYIVAHLDVHNGYTVSGISWYAPDEDDEASLTVRHLEDWRTASYDDVQLVLVEMINAHRHMANKPTVHYVPAVSEVARLHAVDLAEQGSLSFSGANGYTLNERLADANIRLFTGQTAVLSSEQRLAYIVHTLLNGRIDERAALLGDYTLLGIGMAQNTDHFPTTTSRTVFVLGERTTQ